MPIFATLQSQHLFSSLPSPPPSVSGATSPSVAPPIPIPKYLPKPPKNTSLKTHKKPIKSDVAVHSGDGNDNRAVVVTDNGVGYRLPGAPFEFQYSYSETPKVKPLAFREPGFLPFASPSMPRPWTGKAPLKKSKSRKVELSEEVVKSVGVRYVARPRDEVLGEPLKSWEVAMLIKPVVSDNRQVNLGRDGVTHNMLELIHAHWKRTEVCKVRCKGVPTVDMDNVCRVLEEKTGGKIIHRVGGVVYLFRGRNYDYSTRPRYPVMLWKPAAPVYPKLIQEAPEGLTKAEADNLRKKGKNLLPICKLSKNGVYITLVKDVRHAFEASSLVKIDCKGMHASDYKKLGAKLKELVPCVLLSFDDEQILMWRGRDWKSMYMETLSVSSPTGKDNEYCVDSLGGSEDENCKRVNKTRSTRPKMMSLWKCAIDSSKAMLLDEIDLGPDDLLNKVEEFEGLRRAREHSCSALILSNSDHSSTPTDESQYDDDSDNYSVDDTYVDVDDSADFYDSDPLAEIDDQPVPLGSLPIDQIAKKLSQI